jgi:hypothetical protein
VSQAQARQDANNAAKQPAAPPMDKPMMPDMQGESAKVYVIEGKKAEPESPADPASEPADMANC